MKIRVFGSAVVAAALMVFGAGAAKAQSMQDVIAAAQAQLGGEAFDAERIGSLAEVELVNNGRIIEGVFDYQTSRLVDSETYNNSRRASNAQSALNRATLTLPEAIDAALAASPGDVLDAGLVISGRNAGRQFIVDIRTATGIVDVFVDASNGRIIRIVRD